MTDTTLSLDIAAAVAVLRRGGTVAFPTETVYGLGADAANPEAVRKIFAIKRRPADHPLIVHIPDAAQLDRWARDIPAAADVLAARFWPGPLTLILKRHARVSDVVTGGQDSIGLRVPNHPLALDLLRAFGGGIAAPSANRFGHVSPTRAAHVRAEFGEEVDSILDGGACPVGIESTIVSLLGPQPAVLRPGVITAADIAAALDKSVIEGGGVFAPPLPGSLAAHYAPRLPMRLLPPAQLWAEAERRAAGGRRVAVMAIEPAPGANNALIMLPMPADAAAYARDLYNRLREAETSGATVLLVAEPPAGAAWAAVRDRLTRAAAGAGRSG